MGVETGIQWADHTWSPWRGCQKVSDGCKFCYAEALAKRNPAVLGEWGPNGARVVNAVAREEQRDWQAAVERSNRLPADDPSFQGRASPLAWAAVVEADRRRLADVLAGRIDPFTAAKRAEPDRPEPPGFHGVHTGWYRLGEDFHRVGSGPWPEYRPPGLRWKARWTDPKPDDVPWEDDEPAGEATPVEPAPEPRTEPVKLTQRSLFA